MSKTTKTVIALSVAGLATMLAAPAAMAEKGDWIVRGGWTMVAPKSDNFVLPGFIEVTPVDSKPAPGSLVLDVDDGSSFGFNITYMMTDNLGVELLAALPFKHDIKASVAGVGGLGKIAETEHLPPTLSLQYHFLPDGKFRPYVGAGINVTIFSNEKIDPELADKLSLDTSTGIAAQAGLDIPFGERWLVNFDVRWIDIDTKAKITDDVGTETLGTVEIDPFVYSIMIGYQF